MPGPYEKFETAFEAFQTSLRQEIHDESEAYQQKLLHSLADELKEVMGRLLEEIRDHSVHLSEGEREVLSNY